MNGLNHFDQNGNAVMVDVSEKPITERRAVAHGFITMNAAAYEATEKGNGRKGNVLGVAQVAGIMACKRTSDLIPMCHPIGLTHCSVEFHLFPEEQRVEVLCTAETAGQTGVEMEALTGASVALLTIYDMCKAVDRGMVMSEICLLHKSGGKSGIYDREAPDAGSI